MSKKEVGRLGDDHRYHYDYVARDLAFGEYEPNTDLLANALLALADAIAAQSHPTPAVESPTEEEPAPVGVGSVLDGNVTSVAAELAALPAGAAAVARHGEVYQKRTNDTWVACGSNFCVSGRTVGAGAPLTVIWLPEAGDVDE